MREEREAKRRRELAIIWNGPTSATEAAHGTVYGAMQAAVEWVDHFAPARSTSSRAFRAVLGNDVRTKTAAWNEALALAAAA
jgi:ABC-type branched-subunit amino acid transport system substrate-binding protein